jgi:hypothetical protein
MLAEGLLRTIYVPARVVDGQRIPEERSIEVDDARLVRPLTPSGH